MKYKIEILSPLHIGNGNEIPPVEYVMDKRFYRIDMESLFRDEKFDVDSFIENAKFDSFYLGEFYKDVAMKHILYSMEMSDDVKAKSNVREFIKTGGKPYIPGSSIKGAIRTALMWYVLKEYRDIYEEAHHHIRDILYGNNKPDRRYVDNKIEREIFGKDPQHDIMKFFHISDSSMVGYEKMRVENIKILTTRRQGYSWKGFSIPAETIKKGTDLKVEINIDNIIERGDVKNEMQFKDFIIDTIENFGKVCNEYAKNLIDYEIMFFSKLNIDGGLKEIISFYKGLYDILNKNNSILLRMAWGSGWHSMTVGGIIEEDMLDELRLIYGMGKVIHKGCGGNIIRDRRERGKWFCKKCKRGGLREEDIDVVKPFPKSRKVIFENGIAKYPLGWIKLEEIE